MPLNSYRNAVARLRATVESAPSGLLMVDRDGLIVLVNREIERLFGYPREELIGRSVDLLVPEVRRDQHARDRERFAHDPSARRMGRGRELFGRRKDGTEVPVEIGLTPTNTAEGLFVIASVVDITSRRRAESERRQLEAQLRQAQKLEAVGVLAGGIAHDFNNILGIVLGYAELAADKTTDPSIREDLQALLEAVGRGRDVVRRLLGYSRRQNGERKPRRLQDSIEDAAGMLRSTLPAEVALHLDLDPAAPEVLVDETTVHQVLLNLGTNAAHAMATGGRLEILLESIYVRDSTARRHPELAEGPHALLTVRDTGTGMSEEVLSHVFEPFYTTKDLEHGSGLGLAVVKSLLRDHGGTVAVDSRLGEGTQVRCYFPAATGAESAAEAPEAIPDTRRGHGQRILYLDDEPALAEVGRRRLEALGYRVVALTDPDAALAAVRTDPDGFDLVITDHSMPGRTGLELARILVDERPYLPILMLSGWAERTPPEQLAAAGVRRLLVKPVALADLAAAVAELVKER